MKKIVFFLQSLDVGGIETVFIRLLEGINRDEYDIEVKLLYNKGILLEKLPKDIKYSYVFDGKWLIRGYTYFYKYFPLKYLAKKIFHKEYDIIVAYGEGPATQVLSQYDGIAKKIGWLHSAYNKKEMCTLNGSIRRTKRVYTNLDKVICVSSDAASRLKECIGEAKHIKVLINPINSELIKNKAREKIDDIIFDKAYLNFISVGRFAQVKGFERLIVAFSKLINEYNGRIRLYLIGIGNDEYKYRNLIQEHNASDNIFILGYRENAIKYMAQSDVYVCASYREGFSTTVVEAIIANTLVIATDCGGMKDILGSNNEYGIVVNNTDVDLYLGMKQIIQNKKILNIYKEKIKQGALRYEFKTLIKETMDYLNEL